MRSPLTNTTISHNNQLCQSKPLLLHTHENPLFTPINSTATTITSSSQFCYEPTSVLDLRRSPSPVPGASDSGTGFPAVSGLSDDSAALHWDDHAGLLNHPQLLPSEDWDSMMLVFGDNKDDSVHAFKTLPQFPPFESPNPNNNNNNNNTNNNTSASSDPFLPPFLLNDFNPPITVAGTINNANNFCQLKPDGDDSNLEYDRTLLDRLIRAAEAVESNDLQLAQVILARLNQRLQSPLGKPLRRSAFHFKEALQLILSGSNWTPPHLSSSDMIHKIRAYKAFSEISPIIMFANFTANQALLEALDGAMFIHIIDFEIGFGGQWASFMQEIANKSSSRGVPASSLRITAVVSEESAVEARLVKDNLQQFAQELGIQFQIEFVFFRSFEVLLFNAVRLLNSELVAVNLSPTILRHLVASASIAEFLGFLRRITPRITVFVDTEGWKDATGSSFRRNFMNGIEFYCAVLDSLDAVNNGNLDLVRRIEKFLLQPKILASVAGAGNCLLPWREQFSAAGMLPVPFSEFTDSQAEWLVRRTQVRNFHVGKRQGEMLLCWHGRVLVSTSAWK